MKVNGLLLPKLLCELIEAERWMLPEDVTALGELTGVEKPEDLYFLDHDKMVSAADVDREISAEPESARVYGIRSSRRERRPIVETDILDIDQAIRIASSWHEEIGIFLDYRNRSVPVVVVAFWSEASDSYLHREIAASFDDFAKGVGLIPANADR